ncbi:MAG: endo-1,4-beta-xylanase [Pyrinomonadaceae bacterium]|nr:endo-1,4-beta-xylanase [Pyrinomonadaceae bacterium]
MNLKLTILFLILLTFSTNCISSAKGENASNVEEKNKIALRRAKENIEKFRKGNAVVSLDRFKQKDLKIKIRQISHDFKFGCYLKIDDLDRKHAGLYENYFKRLFNYAVVGTYWDVTENKRGEHFWTNFEKEVAMANRNNWRIQTAPILWGSNQAGTPDWLPKEKTELENVLDARIKRYFENYSGAAEDVEIVNENLSLEPDIFADRVGKIYIETAFRQAKSLSPNSRLIINDYGVFGSVSANNYNSDKYFALISELAEKQIPFDTVGIQSHANREWYSPADVAEKLDRYATPGKPVQISEFSAQTKNYDDRASYESILGNYRSGVWTDEKQAEFYREFYTVAFGNPNVEAIVQWGLDDARAWLPGIGLIDENGAPKPNYTVLDQLINREWRTNVELDLKDVKNAEFRGFFGVYEIEIFSGGKSLAKQNFELKKNTPNNFVFSQNLPR